MLKNFSTTKRVVIIELTEVELIDYSKAIVKIGTFLPDIIGVEPPIEEYAILLGLHNKLNDFDRVQQKVLNLS